MGNQTTQAVEGNIPSGSIDISALIRNFIIGLKRFWWMVIVLASIFAGIVYGYKYKTYTPKYQTSATFVVKSEADSATSSYNSNTAKQMSSLFTNIMTSSSLKEKICSDLGTSSVPGTISTNVITNTNLFTITVSAKNAQMAYDILESVINNYPSVAEFAVGSIEMNVIDEPVVPNKPSNLPNFKKYTLIGMSAGIALAVIIILIYAMGRFTIVKQEDIKNHLNQKCISVVPVAYFKKRSKAFDTTVIITNPHVNTGFKEAIKSMALRIEKLEKEQNLHSFIVTSTVPGEGKTTIATNLAISLARDGKKVVVVDFDLRNPSVAGNVGYEGKVTPISKVFAENADPMECVVHIENANVDALMGVRTNIETVEHLVPEKINSLIERLRENYEFVIIDTPPMGIITDANEVANYADGIVYVIKEDYVKVPYIADTISNISNGRIVLAGCVLNYANGVVGSHGGYGYGKYGYGKYGYGKYGYGKYGYGKYGYGKSGYGYGKKNK